MVLAALDRLDPRALAEDLGRHERRWLRAAYALHPFEHAAQYPTAAAAFAALRGTKPDARLAAVLPSAPHPIRFGTFVETRLAAGEVAAAARLLATRPGEYVRRLNALLTRDPSAAGAVLDPLPQAAQAVAPAVLLSALGALRVRALDTATPPRVIFPKGIDGKAHVMPDDRPALPGAVVDQATAILEAEALARAAALPPVEVSIVDTALTDLTAPFTQRVAARALVTLPRGSVITWPATDRLRLFLHWLQGEQRVDLDLSVALFDEAWQHIGTCDYTNLRWGATAAVHSGDRTDAPPPDGASEFVDLELAELAEQGVRHLVAVVFSYNNVAFDDMEEAFAGVMALSNAGGPAFDARAVEQRFDLAGRARAEVPFVLDLAAGTMRWLDVAQGVTGINHAVHRHVDSLAVIGAGMGSYFASPARVRLGEVALWHAAARSHTVLLRSPDGALAAFTRDGDEPVAAFHRRIVTTAGTPASPRPAGLAFLHRGDAPVTPGAEVYALRPASLDPATVHLLAAEELAASLIPR
jgi:hypothetical protein